MGVSLTYVRDALVRTAWELQDDSLKLYGALGAIGDRKKKFADRESGGQATQWIVLCERLVNHLRRVRGLVRSLFQQQSDPGVRTVKMRELSCAPGRGLNQTAFELLAELEELLQTVVGEQRPWLVLGKSIGLILHGFWRGGPPTELKLPADLGPHDCKLVMSFWPKELTEIKVGRALNGLRRFLVDCYPTFFTAPRFELDDNGGTSAIGPHALELRSRKNAILPDLLVFLEDNGWRKESDWPELRQLSKNERRAKVRNLRSRLSRFKHEQVDAGFDPLLCITLSEDGKIQLRLEAGRNCNRK